MPEDKAVQKGKNKYVAPVAIPLGELARGMGQLCSAGSSYSSKCLPGGGAASTCSVGSAAASDCLSGSTPGGGCGTGSSL